MELKMSRLTWVRKPVGMIVSLTILAMSFFRCTEEMLVKPSSMSTANVSTSSTTASLVITPASCSDCKYVVPMNTYTIDGAKLGLQPGDVIGIDATKIYTTPMNFVNIVGTPDKPIIIRNCGGTTATLAVASNASFAMKFTYSKYFRVTGGDV